MFCHINIHFKLSFEITWFVQEINGQLRIQSPKIPRNHTLQINVLEFLVRVESTFVWTHVQICSGSDVLRSLQYPSPRSTVFCGSPSALTNPAPSGAIKRPQNPLLFIFIVIFILFVFGKWNEMSPQFMISKTSISLTVKFCPPSKTVRPSIPLGMQYELPAIVYPEFVPFRGP
jgi:hypothetical protein